MGKTLGYGEITVANMTEPFTVMLTNEAQQFATDSNRKVTSAQSYYTDIIVIRGSQERTDYTIGNITSGSGITVSKSSKRVTFNVSAGTTIGADTGVIEIPITLDGQTVKKQFSWSCGKQGPQGVKGTDGNSFAWNMLSETNCGKKHWGTASSGGKYSVESETTEDNIEAVKLICTESVSSSGWSSTCFTDLEMLKQLKPSTKYTLSYDIKANRSGMISHTICRGDITNSCTNTVVVSNIIGDETWQHISVVLITNDLKTTPTNEVVYLGRTALSKVGYSIIKNLKLTEGYIDTPWSPSQSDIEGKGIAQTVQYYLATSQATGVTSSTSGWSTDITTQKITATKKYLWNCSQTKYTDGTSEPISTPKVIGVYGDKGANALQCKRNWTGTYTTINGTALAALSDFNRTPVAGDVFTTLDGSSNTGTWQVISVNGSNVNIKLLSYVNSRGEKGDNAKNLSITPSSQYFKSTDGGKTFAPNAITIKPTIQGEISFGKWQYSIDGGVSFADVVSGQKGLTISNNVLAVSKDSSLYSDAVTMVTFRAVASDSSFYDTCSIAKLYDVTDIEIGGRNLLLNSDKEYIMGYGIPNTTWTDGYAYIGLPTTRLTNEILPQNNAFLLHPEAGKTYTQTIWIETDANIIDLNAAEVSWFTGKYGHVPVAAKIIKLADNSYKLTSTYTVTKGDFDIRLFDILHLFSALDISNSGTYLKFGKLKVEQGNVSTDWTPAPEDIQTAILSTKSEISDVSLKVDKNKQAIEQRVEKTTYQQDLKLVKGDISKANEGLNKWRYEIYPKSLFASEYQGKSTMDVFAKNTNLTPSQSVLINDTDLSIAWNYAENYIGYALTFAKFSAAKSVAITFAHDDGAHIYLNGKLIGGSDAYNNNGESLTLGFVKGWNCIEVVVNEGANTEGFKLGTTISVLSECQLMNCYYGTPVARQSHITNQLVQNTTDIDGVSGSVQKVMSTVGGSGKIDEFVSNYSTWKKKVDGIETRVGETYTTKSDFNGLEIGGRNLARKGCIALWEDSTTFNDDAFSKDGSVVFSRKSATVNSGVIIDRYVTYEQGQQYIISFKMKANSGTVNNFYLWNGKGHTNNSVYVDGIKSGTLHADLSFPTDGQYHQITAYFTATGTTSTEASDIDVNQHLILQPIKGTAVTYTVQLLNFKIEKGNKATDWTPAPEDNEINGQNLVSNLPSNWEQGSFQDSKTNVGCDYDTNKSSMTNRIRVKELVPVSGTITISNAYSNQSKKPIQHWITAFDINKKWLGASYVSTAWSHFPRIVDMKDAKYIAVIVCYEDGSAITPSDISQICLKIERGTSATPFTLAPEDVNGKIVNVETIATQTATEIGWLINRNGSTASSLKLTENALTAIAENINLTGRVKFSSLSTDAKQGILNSFEVGGRNLALNTSNSYSTAFTSFSGVENTCFGLGQVTCKGIAIGDVVTVHLYIKYTDIVPASGQTARIWTQGSGNITVWNDGGFGASEQKAISGSGEFEFLYSFTMSSAMYINTYWDCALRTDYIASGSIQYKAFKVEKGNKATDWTPAPEDYLPQANLVSNWTTNSTWIDGGKIYTGSITADKIAANAITADKIATDAIKSRNYISSGCTQGSFLNLSDGSFTSPNLSWDSNGNLIATNANLSGKIKATTGKIGLWTLDGMLYDYEGGLYSEIAGEKSSSVWAYDGNYTAYNFATCSYQQKTGFYFTIDASSLLSHRTAIKDNKYWSGACSLEAMGIIVSDSYYEGASVNNNASDESELGNLKSYTKYFSNNIEFVTTYSDYGTSSFTDLTIKSSIYQNYEALNIVSNSMLLFNPTRTSLFSTSDPSKYNAIETTGDAIIGGNCLLRDRSNGSHKIGIYPYDGCIEMYGNTPYIDFHYGSSTSD